MPAFNNLPENQLQELAGWLRSLNQTAFDTKPAGDVAAGEAFFFGKGECASCHRGAHRHHRSPGRSPGKPNCGCGVERSFPAAALNAK